MHRMHRHSFNQSIFQNKGKEGLKVLSIEKVKKLSFVYSPPTSIWMLCFLVSSPSFLGTVNCNTPCFISALIPELSTLSGRRKERAKLPYERSILTQPCSPSSFFSDLRSPVTVKTRSGDISTCRKKQRTINRIS